MRLFRVGEPMALSDVLPLLEHLGVHVIHQRAYEVHPTDSPAVWLYDVGLASPDLAGLDGERARGEFCDAFSRLWRGEARATGTTDSCCAGVLSRKVAVLRAYAEYLRQMVRRSVRATSRTPFANNGYIAALLLDLFEARFDPDRT